MRPSSFPVMLVGFVCLVGLLVLLAARGLDVRMNQMLFAGVFFPMAVELIFGLILLVAFVPAVYSYFVYRRVEGFEERPH